MGYDTRFSGHFSITPSLTVKQMNEVNDYCEKAVEREGEYCDWRVKGDGDKLGWSGAEKFYHYIEWINRLNEKFFKKWHCKLNGVIQWDGEEQGDVGQIIAKDGVITTKRAALTWE